MSSFGDDHGVAAADGEGVTEGEDVVASVEHAFGVGIAEEAWGVGHSASWGDSIEGGVQARGRERLRRRARLAVLKIWQTGQPAAKTRRGRSERHCRARVRAWGLVDEQPGVAVESESGNIAASSLTRRGQLGESAGFDLGWADD